jgi:hypothetical protein
MSNRRDQLAGRGRRRLSLASQCLALLLCAVLSRAADVAPRIEVIEGDGAINNIRLHHAKEPVVRVLDQNGHPIPNVAVTFVLPTQGPGGSFEDGHNSLTVMSDANGRAVGRGLRPNASPGQFSIRVTTSLQGEVATATISQTNAEPSKGGSSKTLLILALVGGAAAAGAAAALSKGKGSSSSSSTTTTSSSGVVITPGSPGFGPPR